MGLPIGKTVSLKNAVAFIISNDVNAPTAAGQSPDDVGYFNWAGNHLWQGVQFGDGNLTFGFDNAVEYTNDRQSMDDVDFGDEAPMDVSLTGNFKRLISPTGSSDDYSLTELVAGRIMSNGATHGNTMTGIPEQWLAVTEDVLTGCVPYCFWLEVHINPRMSCPDLAIEGEAYLFRYCRCDGGPQIDIDAGTITISAKAHIRQPVVDNMIFPYTKDDRAQMMPAEDATFGGLDSVWTAASWVLDPRHPSA